MSTESLAFALVPFPIGSLTLVIAANYFECKRVGEVREGRSKRKNESHKINLLYCTSSATLAASVDSDWNLV